MGNNTVLVFFHMSKFSRTGSVCVSHAIPPGLFSVCSLILNSSLFIISNSWKMTLHTYIFE